MAEIAPWLTGDKVSSKKLSDLVTEGPEVAPWLKEQPSVGEDMAKAAPVGVAKGVIGIAGMGGDLQGLLSGVMGGPDVASDYLKKKTEEYFPNFAKRMESESARSNKAGVNQSSHGDNPVGIKLPSSADIQGKVEGVTGPFYQPQTPYGKGAEVAGSIAPALAAGGESLIGSVIKGIGGGIGSQVAGAEADKYKGMLPESLQPYARPVAESVGAIGGSFIPAGARRAVTPLPQTDQQFNTVERLRQSNPELVNASSAGQLTDSPGLRSLEGRSMQNTPQQEAAFTQGVGRTTGAPAGSTFPEIVQHADDVGSQLRGIRTTNNINPAQTQALVNDIGNMRSDFARRFGGGAAQELDAALGNTPPLQASASGPMYSGERYHMAQQNLQTAIDNALNSDTKIALGQIRDRLKQAFRNSVPPDVAAAEENLSRQYANSSAVSRIKPQVGRDTVTPQEVLSASSKQQGARRTNANEGDLAPLAQDASQVMQPLPNNPNSQGGPFSRLVGAGLAGLFGGAVGHATGTGGLSGAADLAGLYAILGGERGHDVAEVVKNALSRGATSGPAQTYLGNQTWRPDRYTSSDRDQVVRMLLAPPVNRLYGPREKSEK